MVKAELSQVKGTSKMEAQTAAATEVVNLKSRTMPVIFYTIGALGAGEEINFEYYDGTTWRPANVDGVSISISHTGQLVTWWAPMLIRINKPVTAAVVGVGY